MNKKIVHLSDEDDAWLRRLELHRTLRKSKSLVTKANPYHEGPGTKNETGESAGGRFAKAPSSGAKEETKKEEQPAGTWIDHAPGLPYNTMDEYKNGFTPERLALHQQIVANEMKDSPSVPEGQTPTIIFAVGGPASGKSTFAQVLGPKLKAVHVDPDAIREQLPEYQQAIKQKARDAGTMTQSEAQIVAYDKLLIEGLRGRHNVIVDGSGSHKDTYMRIMNDAHKLGYKVEVRASYLDVPTAKIRAAKRAEVTGRNVPDDVIEKLSAGAYSNFPTYTQVADEWYMYDNRGPQAELAWSGGKGVRENVAKPEFVQAYRQQYR